MKMLRHRCAHTLIIGIAWLGMDTGISVAQEPIQIVARIGDQYSGLPAGHEVIRLCQLQSGSVSNIWPFIDESGKVYFVTNIDRTATSGVSQAAYCISDGTLNNLILTEGEHAPGLNPDETVRTLLVDAMHVNHDGRLSISCSVEDGEQDFVDITLFLMSPAGVMNHVRGGSPLLGLPNLARILEFTPAFFSNYDESVFFAASFRTPGSGGQRRAMWRLIGDSPELLFLQDSPIAIDGDDFIIESIEPVVSTNDTGVAIIGLELEGPGPTGLRWTLLRRFVSGKIEIITRDGEMLSEDKGISFLLNYQTADFTSGVMPDGSAVTPVFLQGASVTHDDDFAIVHHRVDGTNRVLAREGHPAGDHDPNLVFSDLTFPPFFNLNGDMLLNTRVQDTTTGVLSYMLYLIPWQGQPILIKPGDPVHLPGTDAEARLLSIGLPSLNNQREVAFEASIEGESVDSSNSECLIVASCNNRLEVVLREGDLLPIERTGRATGPPLIQSLAFDNLRFSDGLNKNGECAAFVSYKNLETAVVKVQVPRFDPADINGDHVIDSLDLSELLSDFGMHGRRSDLNADGVTDTADLGRLLTSYGQICDPMR